MPDAHIKTSFGEIVVSYSELDELEKSLDQLPKAVALLQKKAGGLVAAEPRLPKPGCDGIYRFTRDGRLELLKRPEKKVELVALVMYAYAPDGVTGTDVEAATGLSDVLRNIISPAANKKYFTQKGDRTYTLTPFAFQWVSTKVLPKLK